jgi:hypothetical protein
MLDITQKELDAVRNVLEGADKDTKGDGDAYKKFFAGALKKFGVSDPSGLKGDAKKKFYDYVDANWEADDEKVESASRKEGACTCEDHDLHENCDETCKCTDVSEAAQATWVVTVKKAFNALKKKASVEVVARNTTEALKKAAKKLGDADAWKHSGILDVKKK